MNISIIDSPNKAHKLTVTFFILKLFCKLLRYLGTHRCSK